MREPRSDPFLSRRLALVRELEAAGIHDLDVLAAFSRVPRERFVPPDLVAHAYDDSALGIGHGQTISQPYIVARMTELLALTGPGGETGPGGATGPGGGPVSRRILDVGTGSGYQAAILAALGAEVISIERNPALSASAAARLRDLNSSGRVCCVLGDGSEGWPDGAPYDGIVVAAAAPRVPEPLLAQLADGGRLVVPIGSRDQQWLHVFTRTAGRIDERVFDACVFVPLVGRLGFEA